MENYLNMTGKEFLGMLIPKIQNTDYYYEQHFFISSVDYHYICTSPDGYERYFFIDDYYGQVKPITEDTYFSKMYNVPAFFISETKKKHWLNQYIRLYEIQE